MNRWIFFLCGLVLYSIISCKTMHLSYKTNEKLLSAATDTAAVIQHIYKKINENAVHFQWLSAKIKATLPFYNNNENDKQNNSFTINLRIRKDSLIWMSLNGGLGFEAARIVLTLDSIKILNRINKNLTVKSIDYIESLSSFPLDFYDIQALITGHPAYYNTDLLSSSNNIIYNKNEHNYLLKSNYKKYYHINTWVNAENFKINKLIIEDAATKQSFTTLYNDFQVIDGNQLYPFQNTFKLILNQLLTTEIHLQTTKVKLNEPTTFPFKVPDKYEKVF